MITLILSAPPPSVNTIFRNVAGKGRVKTGPYRAWLDTAGWEVKGQCPSRIAGRIVVDITLKRIKGRVDIDNRIKAVLDLLVGVYVIDDDQYVDEVRARWGGDVACRIKVESVSDFALRMAA